MNRRNVVLKFFSIIFLISTILIFYFVLPLPTRGALYGEEMMDYTSNLHSPSFFEIPVIFDDNYLSATLFLEVDASNVTNKSINVRSAEVANWNFNWDKNCANSIAGVTGVNEEMITITYTANTLLVELRVFAVYIDSSANYPYTDKVYCERGASIVLSVDEDGTISYVVL